MMKKNKNNLSRYATKNEVIAALKSHPKPSNFESYLLIIEHRKISSKIGLVVMELMHGEESVAIGKATIPPSGISDLDSFDWRRLKVGEAEFTSYALDARKQNVSQMLIGAVKKSVSEGRIPFLTFKQ